MTIVLRRYLAFALSAVLVLTAPSMVLARAADGPAGLMVICSDAGAVTVPVDENGAPTGPSHICPDCMAGALTAILPPDVAAPALPLVSSERLPQTIPVVVRNTPLPGKARAPPVPV